MSKFEVGQRVRCFDVNGTDDGEVVKVEPDCITVRHGGHNYSKPGKGLGDQGWHPYQVRRLRKKPSPPAKGEGGTEPVKTSPEGLHAFVVATAKEIRMLAMRRIGERAEHKEAQTWLLYGRIVSVLFAWHFKPSYEYAERRLGLEGGAK